MRWEMAYPPDRMKETLAFVHPARARRACGEHRGGGIGGVRLGAAGGHLTLQLLDSRLRANVSSLRPFLPFLSTGPRRWR